MIGRDDDETPRRGSIVLIASGSNALVDVARLELPIAHDQFCATMDELMPPRRTIMQRNLILNGAGLTIEAGITVRTLVPPGA